MELEEAKPFPHIPDELQRIIFQQAGINYGLLNKSWRTKYLIDQGNIGARVAELPLLRVLFPQMADQRPFTPQHLLELNENMQRLYQILAAHKNLIRLRILPPVTDPAQSLSYSHFREHLSALAKILEKTPVSADEISGDCSFLTQQLNGLLLTIGGIVLAVDTTDVTFYIELSCIVLSAIFCGISCHVDCNTAQQYRSLCNQLQTFLHRSLDDVKREIRESEPIEIVIHQPPTEN